MALNLEVEGLTPHRVLCPYLPLDPFSSRERPRSSKKGAATTAAQTFTFFQVLDPLLRPERPRSPKKGRRNLTSKRAAIWFFSVPWPHIEALLLSALSVPVCLCACQGCFLLGDPFPETLFGMTFAEHTFHTRLA